MSLSELQSGFMLRENSADAAGLLNYQGLKDHNFLFCCIQKVCFMSKTPIGLKLY